MTKKEKDEAATAAANLQALAAATAGTSTSTNAIRGIKARLITSTGQVFWEGEYRKPGRAGVVKADLRWIASHTTPSLVFVPDGDEYVV